MRLLRYGPAGQERPALLDNNNQIRDLTGHIDDLSAAAYSQAEMQRLAKLDPQNLPLVEGTPRIGSPISKTGHFIAIGLNYADHAAESGMPIPAEPILFTKAPSSLCGPNDAVVIPKGSKKLDWEIELAVIISKPAYQITEADALEYIAGYTICNDISERHWQIEGTGQWTKGKSAPTFGPLGPYLVTPDEVRNPENLALELRLNGKLQQSGNTANMIFSVRQIVAYLSGIMQLEPGDIITTGTPPGVGMGAKPPFYLKPDDEMVLTIEGLGRQHQTVAAQA
ncbi:5-carboxymethyl-2-hydroxymuconate isomerase/ureidoglycolate lyase [Roseibium hamelinense]|uniref:5-carboxymethyl-2-hydroxymuconate isomerase/ureidoglycolate lyase n=1 Tax=Roseibium hamelinense TaxID=150831 RepID=A0A562T9I2_9HYPH|nr:fumarylacetoacetate hydrolase family protein [Roseibium hamelinense]MTI45306.1 FAA hydrolase family protein [Roseibium hamelinense]TWI90327.1 5-carboxymethyl-2-hydroxymuconate isomerase/ureidoglycolate lyase [Roseibium hamelinense]